jgi:hypothetical protein
LYIDASHLLMEIYAQRMEANLLRQTADETLARFPTDPSWLARPNMLTTALRPSPDTYLNASLALYQQGKFDESIQSAREALKLRPDHWEAWNNIAAAYNSESNWDEGIRAGQPTGAEQSHLGDRAEAESPVEHGDSTPVKSNHVAVRQVDVPVAHIEDPVIYLIGVQYPAGEGPCLLFILRGDAQHVACRERKNTLISENGQVRFPPANTGYGRVEISLCQRKHID